MQVLGVQFLGFEKVHTHTDITAYQIKVYKDFH